VRRPARILVILAIVLLQGSLAPGSRAQSAEAESSITLPVSFGKVWFRPGKSGLGGGKQSGLLTVSGSGLEFSAKKQSHVLPWSRVEMISYGRMSGDLDTKWVVVALNPVAGQSHFIGYRDGQKLGYGGATTRVFDAIVEGLRQAGAGPFAVPPGHSVYITPFLQFTLALPQDWHPYRVSETFVDGRPTWGRMIFSRLDLEATRGDAARAKQALASIESGSERAVYLDRFEAGDGFTCRRLGKAGRRRLRQEIDAGFRPMQLVSELEWTSVPHRYCTAWTAAGRARLGDTEFDVAFYAVSDDQTAYVFTARTAPGTGIDERFESISRSLRTAVAR
jgi:hypothetical protein